MSALLLPGIYLNGAIKILETVKCALNILSRGKKGPWPGLPSVPATGRLGERLLLYWGAGRGFGGVFILFCHGELPSPPCWPLTVLLSLFPPPHPAGSSRRVTHPSFFPPIPSSFVFWLWVFLIIILAFLFPCKKKIYIYNSGLGGKVRQMELWLGCQVPPAGADKEPGSPAPTPSLLSQKLTAICSFICGGEEAGEPHHHHHHTPPSSPGCVHCCGVFYCVTRFRGRCGTKSVGEGWGGELG